VFEMRAQRITVLVVNNCEIFREGLATLIEGKATIGMVYTCSNGLEAVEKARRVKPDVVLMDIELPRDTAIRATSLICEQLPKTRVLMLTKSDEDSDLLLALKAGAKGYISRNTGIDQVIKTITLTCQGDIIVPPSIATRLLLEFARLERKEGEWGMKEGIGLSQREKEVLRLVAKGDTNREIANSLFITENTVKVHMHNIMGKLEVCNRRKAVALAIEKGLVPNITAQDT